jgi:GTPase-associated protein 1, middle domain/GTPase-associated protein 1, N-terminal domain type 2
MVEQLCYTWSAVGLSGSAGYQIRAASKGVADTNSKRVAAFDEYLEYRLPTGTNSSTATRETSPFCLAYVSAGSERILVHKVYVGQEVYFTHLLADLSETFSVRFAIDMWISPFWYHSESLLGPQSVELPSVSPDQLVCGSSDVYDISTLEDYLPCIMQAFLTPEEVQKLYIVAPARQVATLIWGLTHSLPLSLLKQFTFSTYEHDPKNASMRIVGTCHPYTEQETSFSHQNLSTDYYNEKGLVLNWYAGKCPEVTLKEDITLYAQFAISRLSERNFSPLNEIIALAEQRNIDKIDLFLSIYEYFCKTLSKRLSSEDITSVLSLPDLGVSLLKIEPFQSKLINEALTNPQWWYTSGRTSVAGLYTVYRIKPDEDASATLNAFVNRLVTEICNANKNDLIILIKFFEAIASADNNPAIRLELFYALTQKAAQNPPSEYSPEHRISFLKLWAPCAESISDQQILPWLKGISWEELGNLLGLHLPSQWEIRAIAALITSPIPVPRSVVDLAIKYYDAFKGAVKHIMEQTLEKQQALNFFVFMVANGGYSDKRKIEILEILLFTNTIASNTGEVLLKARLSREEIKHFFGTHGHRLLVRHSTGNIPEAMREMITIFVEEFRLHNLKHKQTRDCLKLISPTVVDPETTGQCLRDWLVIEPIMSEQDQREPDFQAIGEAIQRLQLGDQEDFKKKLFLFMVKTTLENEKMLRTAIEYLSPFLIVLPSKEADGANRELLRQLATLLDGYETSDQVFIPYIKLSITYATHLKGKNKFVEPLLQNLLKNVDREIFDAIEKETKLWPDQIRKEWQHYSAALRPTTIWEQIGNAIVALWRIMVAVSKRIMRKLTSLLNRNLLMRMTILKKATIGNPIKVIRLAPSVNRKPKSQVKTLSLAKTLVLPKSPDKQQTPQNSFGNSILQPVSQELIDKVAEVKNEYIYYRYNKINSRISSLTENENKGILLDALIKEKELLIMQESKSDNKQEWIQEIKKELWIDQLIDRYIQTLPDEWVQSWQTTLQQEHAQVCEGFKDFYESVHRKNLYRVLQKKSGITENELKKILLIFVRYYSLATDLYCRDNPLVLDDQLLSFKKQFPFDSMDIQRTAVSN